MRTIAIVLGDNDYSCTFIPLLETLKRTIEWRKGEIISEDNIRLIVRHNMLGHYLAFQHRFDLDYEFSGKYFEDVKVLFDEEAERHIATHDHDGGSWYLELQSGKVSSY